VVASPNHSVALLGIKATFIGALDPDLRGRIVR
jgi:hypothetical protein